MMHPIKHFKTITAHRNLVCRYCLRLGLVWQGLTHDLSKYSPAEFWSGAKYYQGTHSPNDQERKENGVSLAWLHHKGRNKHHFEYWADWQFSQDGKVIFGGHKMPMRYLAEMFCDRLAASKIYMGDNYTDASPYEYLQRGLPDQTMHPETLAELQKMLLILKDEGEQAAFQYVRMQLQESKKRSKI